MLIALFALASLHYLRVVWTGFRSPIVCDLHSFRGSQTAIGAWSVMRTGRNKVPVLGCGERGEWAIPFELPLYQRCVAAVAGMMGGKPCGCSQKP